MSNKDNKNKDKNKNNKKRPSDNNILNDHPNKKPTITNNVYIPKETINLLDDDDSDYFNILFNKYIDENDHEHNNDINNNDNDDDNDTNKELVIINKKINCLLDLIELGKIYDKTKRYNIDLKILFRLVDSLTELNNMIGMESVKQDMVDHILFRIQNLDNSNQDMMHTVIQGPPGVGKTEVAKIIGKVYLAMGILKNNKFIKAKRSDLIAGYLGQTAKATQKIIDSAIGGILFIDEVYSLGNPEKKDSFSKECIDTINENLTENKTDFICIIAGYKDEIDSCFFAFNSGLERRFPVRFTIEPYNPDEIYLIFKKKVYEFGWSTNDTINISFFTENIEHFKFFGGDMEILFSRCKRAHSRRIFASKDSNKKVLNLTDLKKGFESFKNHRKNKETDQNNGWKNMYM